MYIFNVERNGQIKNFICLKMMHCCRTATLKARQECEGKRDGIVLLPSRMSLYIEGSRSPLTVNNCRFRIVTSGTRDSGFRARLCTPDGFSVDARAFIDVTGKPRDRRKFLKDNARFEEYEQRSRKNIRFRARRGMCILRKSIHTRVRVSALMSVVYKNE